MLELILTNMYFNSSSTHLYSAYFRVLFSPLHQKGMSHFILNPLPVSLVNLKFSLIVPELLIIYAILAIIYAVLVASSEAADVNSNRNHSGRLKGSSSSQCFLNTLSKSKQFLIKIWCLEL